MYGYKYIYIYMSGYRIISQASIFRPPCCKAGAGGTRASSSAGPGGSLPSDNSFALIRAKV